jgi:hypothetical protein
MMRGRPWYGASRGSRGWEQHRQGVAADSCRRRDLHCDLCGDSRRVLPHQALIQLCQSSLHMAVPAVVVRDCRGGGLQSSSSWLPSRRRGSSRNRGGVASPPPPEPPVHAGPRKAHCPHTPSPADSRVRYRSSARRTRIIAAIECVQVNAQSGEVRCPSGNSC